MFESKLDQRPVSSCARPEFRLYRMTLNMESHLSIPDGQLALFFVRHGETQDNIDRVLQGQRDTSLTANGHSDAVKIAQKLATTPIAAIYHSPLLRIRQTIQPLLDQRLPNPVPHYADPDLMGQRLGTLEGGSYDTVDLNNPRSADGQPGVEIFDDFVRRLKRALGLILAAEAPQVTPAMSRVIVVATHGVGITALLMALEGTLRPADGAPFFPHRLACRGPYAYAVRWPDSDDIAKVVISRPGDLPILNGGLDWNDIDQDSFVIEAWGKKEKSLPQPYPT
jgi:broad specificity phosphatase PhoE